MLRRRWIEAKWRQAAVRHGFEEIDGPRFEHADLYTVKSGEGILSELFSFKRWAPGEGPLSVTKRAGSSPSPSTPSEPLSQEHAADDVGTWYALRPEFTPTLARMVAAKANSLPRPIKWFSVGPYFRAERPQRGRLREFLQWNVDLLGSAEDDEETKARQDAEVIACCVEMLRNAGLTPDSIRIKHSNRELFSEFLMLLGVPEELLPKWFQLLDRISLSDHRQYRDAATLVGIDDPTAQRVREAILEQQQFGLAGSPTRIQEKGLAIASGEFGKDEIRAAVTQKIEPFGQAFFQWSDHKRRMLKYLCAFCVDEWVDFDFSIVRGLAYYTGMVFEVHEVSGKERAIAGGGRYDKLVELFGGAPTPAVGFAMGDVVLANVLQDKGLMPSDAELAAELGLRPDVFVISTGKDESEAQLMPVVAALHQAGLHARHTYKSTRNIGKLLKEAGACAARFALIIESADAASLKNLDTGEQTEVPLAEAPARIRAATM